VFFLCSGILHEKLEDDEANEEDCDKCEILFILKKEIVSHQKRGDFKHLLLFKFKF
jgi:hypothetical protein